MNITTLLSVPLCFSIQTKEPPKTRNLCIIPFPSLFHNSLGHNNEEVVFGEYMDIFYSFHQHLPYPTVCLTTNERTSQPDNRISGPCPYNHSLLFQSWEQVPRRSREPPASSLVYLELPGPRDYIHRNIAEIRPNQSFTQEYLKRLISAVASAVPPLRLIIINRQITRYASGVLQVAM